MKDVFSKNGRTITTILFVLVVFVLGSFNFEFLNVQAESIDQEDKLLEIRQGDFLHYFLRGSEGLTFQLDVKDPESGGLYNWQILVPPMHGGASVSTEGKSTEVSYLPAETYSGDDHFLVEVSTNTGARAKVNVAITVKPGDSYPVVENLPISERGEPTFPPRYQTEQEFPREDEQDERFDPRLVEIDALREMKRQSQLDEIGRSSDGEVDRGDPYISVLPQRKQVKGIGWSPNTSIILTIGTQEWTEESDECGNVYFFTHPFDIQPDQVVEMTDGTYTRTHTVTILTVTDVDEDANTVSGTAQAESEVDVYGRGDVSGYEDLSVSADSSGDWTATFSIIDIAPGAEGYASQYDAEGNSTQIFWFVPDPYFQVYPKWDRITGYVWTPDTLVTATVGGNTIGSGWSNEVGLVFISSSFDLQPDDKVMLTDGIYTRTHTVTSLTVTNVDEVADSVSGKAEAGSDVHIDGSDDYDREALIVTADSSGDWTATFSIIDIAPGADGEAYQYDAEGNSTTIHWDVPDPRIQVYPLRDYIHGNDWASNTPVTLTIGTEEWIEESDEKGWVYFDTYPFDIQPGQVVEMTDGTYTRTHTVTSLTVTNVDEVADTVSGTAAVESEVFVDGSDGFDVEYMWVTVDTSGNWIANFPHLDIESGTYGKALQHDEEGNSTTIHWDVPDPRIQVYPLGDYIRGYEWSPDSMVTLNIDNTYSDTGYSDIDGYVGFDLYSFDLIPGQVVEMSDGSNTRTHTVKNLAIVDVDQDLDVVTGTADPFSEITTYACDDLNCQWIYSTADDAGSWNADFSLIVDIVPGSDGWAVQHDEEGNSTVIRWFVPDPYMRVYPQDDHVYGYSWPPDTTITLTIGESEWTGVSRYNGRVSFYIEPYDIQVGQSVIMSAGTFTKNHKVRNLSVTSIDEVNDTLSGTAKANDPVDVRACDYYCSDLTVTADGSGNWTADFSGLVDIAQGVSGSVSQYDADDDSTTISWTLLDPYFDVRPLSDYIVGWDWTPNTPITLEIDSTLIATEDSSWWGYVEFYPESFDIQPGQEVVLSDGTYTKTHTVIDLAVTTVDEVNDVLSGTADPGTLTIDAYDDDNWEMLNPVADANGDWTANFATVDITEGSEAYIYQSDEDNDRTFIYWLIPDPKISVQPQVDLVYGDSWPQNTDITLTIENTRETWVQRSSERGSVYFDLEPFGIQPGDIVKMTADSYTQEHIIRDISVTEIDQVLDTVSGRAEPESGVLVCAYSFDGYDVIGKCKFVNADASGDWLAEFAGSVDISAGSWGDVTQSDQHGNDTYISWEVEYLEVFLPLILR